VRGSSKLFPRCAFIDLSASKKGEHSVRSPPYGHLLETILSIDHGLGAKGGYSRYIRLIDQYFQSVGRRQEAFFVRAQPCRDSDGTVGWKEDKRGLPAEAWPDLVQSRLLEKDLSFTWTAIHSELRTLMSHGYVSGSVRKACWGLSGPRLIG
jgi:hypothetical protein